MLLVIEQKSLFLENAKLLNNEFEIIPLMYGSLGLEYITNQNLNSDDIDILIPNIFLNEKWDDFKRILEKNGYVLIDEHEHTFQKNNISYSYASFEELESFAKISLLDIEEKIDCTVRFKLLSLEQYLDKILFIKKHLK